jgi:integrase
MESAPLLDCAGRRRSPATFPGYHQGRPPHNKGLQYPPDPPTVEEITAVLRAAGETPDGLRLRGLVVVLWRAGLRISEALALTESDLDPSREAVLVRRGKGGKRREVGMDRWARDQLSPWLRTRASLPVGALFCVLHGPTRGRPCSPAGLRANYEGSLSRLASDAGSRHINSVTRTRSRCRGRAFPWSSSSASSDTPTSGSLLPICAESTTPRSSTLSTSGPHR